jgi:hypothetical protein
MASNLIAARWEDERPLEVRPHLLVADRLVINGLRCIGPVRSVAGRKVTVTLTKAEAQSLAAELGALLAE